MNRYDYSTAADYARLVGYDRTTVMDWIRAGKIKAFSRVGKPKNSHYRICDYEFAPKKIAQIRAQKPYLKYKKPYSNTEKYIIQNNDHLTAKQIAKMINRNPNSVRVKRSRMRREGRLNDNSVSTFCRSRA